jgi:hypothetical protein
VFEFKININCTVDLTSGSSYVMESWDEHFEKPLHKLFQHLGFCVIQGHELLTSATRPDAGTLTFLHMVKLAQRECNPPSLHFENLCIMGKFKDILTHAMKAYGGLEMMQHSLNLRTKWPWVASSISSLLYSRGWFDPRFCL